MTDSDDTYSGWTNRETWLANLWITNEEWSYNAATSIVSDLRDDAEPDEDWDGQLGVNGRLLVGAAADALEEWATETFVTGASDLLITGFVSDLLGTAWGRIDWREIAAALLEP